MIHSNRHGLPGEIEEALAPLGFTGTEAAVYVELLRGGPRTGYGVAKALGKPAAPVYGALDALRQKGAVLGTADEPRLWTATEPDVLLRQLEVGFRASRDRAGDLLGRLASRPGGDDVYRLGSADQVLARAREMLLGAESVALLDCFPEPLALLRDDIEMAAGRGVAVGVVVYEDGIGPPGVEVVRSTIAAAIRRDVPGAVLQCAVDGARYLAALLEASGALRTGFWTENPLMAGLAHNGLAAELGYTRLTALAEAGASAEDLRRVREAMAPYVWRGTPGFERLREQP